MVVNLSKDREAELLADFKRREAERRAAWEQGKELTKQQKQNRDAYYANLVKPHKSRKPHLCERCACMMETGTLVIRRRTWLLDERTDWAKVKTVTKYRHANAEECHA